MQLILLATVLAFLAKGSAMPITPAAPELQLLADKMRSEGVSEVRDCFCQPSCAVDADDMLTGLAGNFGASFAQWL